MATIRDSVWKSAKGRAAGQEQTLVGRHTPTLLGLYKTWPVILRSVWQHEPVLDDPESSLVDLSRQVAAKLHGPRRGARLRPPGPPPVSARPGTPRNRRHAADPTDHDVDFVEQLTAPPGTVTNPCPTTKGSVFEKTVLGALGALVVTACGYWVSAQTTVGSDSPWAWQALAMSTSQPVQKTPVQPLDRLASAGPSPSTAVPGPLPSLPAGDVPSARPEPVLAVVAPPGRAVSVPHQAAHARRSHSRETRVRWESRRGKLHRRSAR